MKQFGFSTDRLLGFALHDYSQACRLAREQVAPLLASEGYSAAGLAAMLSNFDSTLASITVHGARLKELAEKVALTKVRAAARRAKKKISRT